MRKLILALALAAFASPAFALDCEVSAPSTAALNSVAAQIAGLWAPASTDPQTGATIPAHIIPQGTLANGGAFVYVHWGLWWKPTGATATDSFGNTVPALGNDGLDHSLLRWNADPALMPIASAAGATQSTNTTTGVLTITAPAVAPQTGNVVLTCPPPSGFPVSF